ncbi:DUF3027 domain-containing protein [Herbiconiux sp. CPCC 203407]|uniref:DUF3027 domain-containing protein n=1 Tax=Herbiconiux oxytropis TaxID=2970915 RepID=A0AA41XAZ7_9MICO|nr:DUF3027 domain-containing protein [Herbiconiux oxytropis]MCS5721060.1 DUF3027 domain-containing protein [Herbiconiux oxytropis]MCS5724712.1 DUF3027 domain-containing protein [Herbiconiux oxytropis]
MPQDAPEPGAVDEGVEETAAIEPAVDEVLLGSVQFARAALVGIAPAGTVGELAGSRAEEDHVLSLFFASKLPGYPDWRWTVTLARVDEESEPTVLEVELLPGETSLVAPDWVPWSERLAEYQLAQELAAATAAEGDDDDEDLDDEDEDLDDDEHDDDEHPEEDDDDDLDEVDLDDVTDLDDHIADDDELAAAAEEIDDDEDSDDEPPSEGR